MIIASHQTDILAQTTTTTVEQWTSSDSRVECGRMCGQKSDSRVNWCLQLMSDTSEQLFTC